MITADRPAARQRTARGAVLAMAIAAILSMFSGKTADAAAPSFIDVPSSHAFFEEINWMASEGITTGYQTPAGYEYRPTQSILREQMAVFLHRMAGSPAVTLPSSSPYLDVAPTHNFYRAIVWLDQQGISSGYNVPGGRQFRPSQPVLREQMASFLYRYKGSPSYNAPTNTPFVDVPRTHTFYKQIAWLNDTGISTGYPEDGTFRPSQPVLREQMAAFLFRTFYLP